MIVLDTSAVLAVLLKEAEAPKLIETLSLSEKILMSGGTLAECPIVAQRRRVADKVLELVDELDIEIVPVARETARSVAAAHAAWGKGVHPAGLNFGDCFAYALAAEYGCPLLYVGNDFAQTDLVGALRRRG